MKTQCKGCKQSNSDVRRLLFKCAYQSYLMNSSTVDHQDQNQEVIRLLSYLWPVVARRVKTRICLQRKEQTCPFHPVILEVLWVMN